MNITKYTEDQIKQFVQDGICPVQALRDYKVLKEIQNGEKIKNVAYDNDLSRMHVYRLKRKYSPR